MGSRNTAVTAPKPTVRRICKLAIWGASEAGRSLSNRGEIMETYELEFVVSNECDECADDDVWTLEVDIYTEDVVGEYSMGHQERWVGVECKLAGAESSDGIWLSPESWRQYLRDAREWIDFDDWLIGQAFRIHNDCRGW